MFELFIWTGLAQHQELTLIILFFLVSLYFILKQVNAGVAKYQKWVRQIQFVA